jgi:uncharacterized protein
MRRTRSALCSVALALACGAAGAASFPCEKAQSRIEKAICADAQVSELDEYLGRYYHGARTTLGRAASCLATDQKQWLSAVRNKCADAACLKKVYLERLAELHPVQPGATSLRNVELPVVQSLVWIIPPASDTVAAPPQPRAKPFEAKGRVVNEIVQGDGFVLRTADGTGHILMTAMLMEGPADGILVELAKEPKATFLARGHASNDRGNINFEPSRCIFLYRLP